MNYDALINWPFETIFDSYDADDAILYALALGAAADPAAESELRFVYEENLAILPTFAVTIGYPGLFLADRRAGVDIAQMLHGEHSLTVHKPLPTPPARVRSLTGVEEIIDKGPGRGALVYTTRETHDDATGELLTKQRSTSFCRADGGFGGPSHKARPPRPLPDRPCDVVVRRPTLPQAALLYRLCGDRNPLHADPEYARQAGYSRPILHGLCSYGVAALSLIGELCDGDAARLKQIDCRFTAPVYPGEVIETSVWVESPGVASFRCAVVARRATVIDNGYAEFEPPLPSTPGGGGR